MKGVCRCRVRPEHRRLRLLHSTGQLHKSDAGSRRFIQILTSPKARIAPSSALDAATSEFDFVTLNLAQVHGDASALRAEGRAVFGLPWVDTPEAALRMLVTALRHTGADP